MAAVAVLIVRVSAPQSETVWSVYETPGDLIRVALGLAASLWVVLHMFKLPKDEEAYRIWLYVGLVVVPFALIVAIAVW
jgi:hypothetical protein